MRDRRVIYDSEDEDGGFSPVNSPVKGGAPAVAHVLTAVDGDEGGRAGQVEEPTSDSRSTDPEFFKQIYEQQQHRQRDEAAEDFSATAGPAREGSSDKQKSSDPKAKNNSSSITDPALKSSKKRSMRKVDEKALASLTQVTTPSAPGAKQRDVYDFPLSEEEGVPAEPSITRTRVKRPGTAKGKRKRNQQPADPEEATTSSSPSWLSNRARGSSPGHAIQIEDDVSPRPARKKRKSAQLEDQRQRPDDVDLLVIPTPAEMDDPPAESLEGLNDHGGVVGDTFDMPPPSRDLPPASFFIAPPTRLSASQKQEYLQVSSYSELDDVGTHQQQPSLPPPKPLPSQGQVPPNTDSTILYTTPSRYCPSAPPLPLVSSSHMATPGARRTQLDEAQPQSSPDELTLHPLERTGRSVKRKRDEPEPTEPTEPAQDDSWDSDKIGFHKETYVPRPSRRRSGADPESVRESPQPEASNGSAPKKRQRKPEQLASEHDDSWDSDNIGFHRETYVPRPSRRRSRAVVDGDEDLDAPGQSMPDTCPPGDGSFHHVENADPIPISPGNHAPQDDAGDIGAIEGLDPEFLEAMPEDIRREIISNHILQQSARNSQAPQTRSRGRPRGTSSRPQPASDETPQPKKRGRRRKEQQAESAPLTAEDAGEQGERAPTGGAKRKRGRPKKVEAVQVPAATEAAELAAATNAADFVPSMLGADIAAAPPVEPAQDAVEAPKAPSKRGRKKKAVDTSTTYVLDEPATIAGAEETARDPSEAPVLASEHHTDDAVEPARAEDEREALRDISNMASQDASGTSNPTEKPVSQGFEKQEEVTPEPKAKDIPRSALTTGQQGKVPLRVGLSKKSRITPLLKMIRK